MSERDRGRRVARSAVLKHPAGWLASGFGAGLSPFAPGTVGSAAALVPYWFLRELPPAWLVLAIAATFALGVWCSAWIIRTLREEDPGVVVLDEFVGQWIALAIMEAAAAELALTAVPWWLTFAIGFFAFRLCDIAKPWPASWADAELDGGFGAMADDAFAGVWAGALGTLAAWLAARYVPL